MEADWERKNAFIPLDLDAAWRMLSPFGIVPHSLELLAEGKANTNYKVTSARGQIVLRIYQRDPKARQLEETILGCLPMDFPTPWIVARGKEFTLFEFCSGSSLERLLIKRKAFPVETVARQLARARLELNTKRCRAAGFFEIPDQPPLGCRVEELNIVEPWPSAIDGLLGYLRFMLPHLKVPNALKDRINGVVDDAEPRLQAIAGPPVLVHGDFKPSNLLVDETGLTAVLDWEFAHAGTWLSDVGQLLRHPESLPEGFADAFLDELDAPPDTMILARTLDLVNLIDFLHKEKGQPKMRVDVTHRIGEVCGLYERRFDLKAKRS